MAEHQASAAQRFFTDLLVAHLTSPHFVQDEAELRRIAEEGGFCPTTNRFAVLVVQIERWSNLFSSEAQWLEATKHHFFLLTNMLQELLDQENLAIIAEKDYQLVCLVNLRQRWPAFRSALLTLLQQMMEVMETEFDVSVSIAVSEEAAGLTGLPGAYQQALDVLWYNTFLEEDRQITFYEDLYGDLLPMIRSDLTVLDKKLITKLQLRDAAGVKYVLHEMIDREFLQARPSVQILKTRLGGISCKILDALEELKASMGDDFYYQLNPGPRIVEARTLSELTSNMDELFDAVDHRQNDAIQEPKPQWVDKMSVFIESHYMDESLGLTEVSSAFGITPSYATRVFKQYTGRGIYETIQHVRLAAAKSLMSTGRTMKEIAQMVGYTSFLSMNRAFKKYEGATPSQFRDQ